jgi:hypothetical protein
MSVQNYWLLGIRYFIAFIVTDGLNVDVAVEKQALLIEFWHCDMLRGRERGGYWKMTLRIVLGR